MLVTSATQLHSSQLVWVFLKWCSRIRAPKIFPALSFVHHSSTQLLHSCSTDACMCELYCFKINRCLFSKSQWPSKWKFSRILSTEMKNSVELRLRTQLNRLKFLVSEHKKCDWKGRDCIRSLRKMWWLRKRFFCGCANWLTYTSTSGWLRVEKVDANGSELQHTRVIAYSASSPLKEPPHKVMAVEFFVITEKVIDYTYNQWSGKTDGK